MADIEYIIAGDTERNIGCLVFTCGESKDRAKEILKRITTFPTENDRRIMEGHANFRIEEVPKEDCWWNGNCD